MQERAHHSDIDWSQFRVSKAALARIKRSTEIVLLGRNAAGDYVYALTGTRYYLYFHEFPTPTAGGKLAQVYVAPAP